MPRPTVITDKVLSELKTAFSMDCTDKEACEFAGISEKTLYNYQRTYPEFLQQKHAWKTTLILQSRKTIQEKIEKGDAELALKYLKSKLPDEFEGSSRRRKSKTTAEDNDISEIQKIIENAKKSRLL